MTDPRMSFVSRPLAAVALAFFGLGLPSAVSAGADVAFVDGTVVVRGAPPVPRRGWEGVLVVTVAGAAEGVPPVAGTTIQGGVGRIVFEPSFPFFPGVRYRAVFHPPGSDPVMVYHSQPKEGTSGVAPAVSAVFPSGGRLPQNQLKFYIHFSQAMARGYAQDHIRLLDAEGEVVPFPFLDLDEELWDGDGRRFTLFLDPGRVKRGLKPHEEAGPALVAGQEYTLEVAAGWKGAGGTPMERPYRKKFRTTGPDYRQPRPVEWVITAPASGSESPLVVMLGEPLDHALLGRVVDVRRAGGGAAWVDGTPRVTGGEGRWEFVPGEPWRDGAYELVVGTELEDLAGNSVRKPFEITPTNPGSIVAAPVVTVPFSVGAPREGAARDGAPSAHRGRWPQWRGPTGDSRSSSSPLPTAWDGESGRSVVWKSELQGDGASTPVVWDGKIFLTSQVGSGPVAAYRGNPPPGDKTVNFVVHCLSLDSGEVLWERHLKSEGDLEAVHPLQNLATPSCATDGERLVALFGTGQMLSLTPDGETLWQRHLGVDTHRFQLRWGHSSSPVLHRGQLFVLCDHDPAACLLALDADTGKEQWRVDHGRGLRSYSSPVVAEIAGRDQIIVNSNPGISAYDAGSGERVWRWKEFCKVPVPLPTVADGILFASRGYTNGPLMAVPVENLSGEVGEGDVLWRWASRAPYVSSPLLVAGLLFLSDERGQLFVAEAETGEVTATQKLGSSFWSSPVAGDGKVFLLDETGETVVITAERDPHVLARNRLPGDARGSIAVAGNRLLIRTENALWCLGSGHNEG